MTSVLVRVRRAGRKIAASSLAGCLMLSASLTAFSQEKLMARVAPPAIAPVEHKGTPGRALQPVGELPVKTDAPPPAEPEASATPGVVTVQAQQSAPPQNPITQPLTLSPDVSRQRVGVNLDQEELLALQDAVAMALRNNLDIEANRQSVQIAQYNLFSARGFYDFTSTAESGYRSATRPTASVFGGGGESGAVNDKSIYYNFTTGKNIESTGGNFLVEFDNSRSTTSATFAQLTTQYNNNLTFTFTQPLMRNFKIDVNRRNIQVLKKAVDLSDSQFRQRVIEIISSTQRAYWDLVFAIRNEQIARQAVELAQVQLENNRKMVEAGTLAPIELRSTEAAVESRKEQVILALQSITTAENTLKGLLLKDPNDRLWTSVIKPTDEPQFGQLQFDLQESVQLALKNRPELDQVRLQAEQNQIDINFYKNQLKPQLDFVGFYTNTGLAGTPAILPGGTTQAGLFDQRLLNFINQIRPANTSPFVLDPIITDPGPVGIAPRFQGGYFRSLGNLLGQDFRTFQAGVRLSFPWKNRTAEGNYGRSLAEARQLDARQRQLVQSVQIDVRNALQSVEAARQRFEAARANRIAAKAQLEGEQEKFRAGLSTNFFVLERQNDLAVALGNEVRALTDYNKALADLQRVTGMTLVSNNVQVPSTEEKDNK